MRVIASAKGFYKHRRRPLEIFEMDESAMKKDRDGRPILPRWVEPVKSDEGAKRLVAGLIGIDASVARRAAIAASVVKRKPQTFVEAMRRKETA